MNLFKRPKSLEELESEWRNLNQVVAELLETRDSDTDIPSPTTLEMMQKRLDVEKELYRAHGIVMVNAGEKWADDALLKNYNPIDNWYAISRNDDNTGSWMIEYVRIWNHKNGSSKVFYRPIIQGHNQVSAR